MKLEDVLRGLKLNVVVGAYAGSYFNYNNETGIQPYGGIVAEIMDELAERAGFTWRDSFGIYDVPSGGVNETWTDLLVWSIDSYDLTIDWWAKSLARMNLGVAFLRDWYDSSIILISKQNLVDEVGGDTGISLDNFGNWMEPFTWEVRCCGVLALRALKVCLLVPSLTACRDDRFGMPPLELFSYQELCIK
ncbi:MAG: hypothetical protein SGBAC_011966 [Bacillariaceae sp.]